MMEEQDKLTAWCEWKKWCSILRVKNPCPTEEESAAGIIDDIDGGKRKSLYQYLYCRIKYSIESKYKKKSFIFDMDDFISIFDCRMKRKFSHGFGPYKADEATHKDYLFYQVEKSKDPALKVINGIIFQRFYLSDTIKEYLDTNSSSYVLPGTNTRVNPGSLDASAYNDPSKNNRTRYDEIADGKDNSVEYDFTIQQEADRIYDLLNPRERIMMLVMLHNMQNIRREHKIILDDPELNRVAGVGRDGCSLAQQSMQDKIRQEAANIGLDQYGQEIIVQVKNKIISDLKAEKTAKRFLDKLLSENLSVEKEN